MTKQLDQLSLRLPKVAYTFRTNQKQRLQTFAKQDGRTVSNVVNIAVKDFLQRRGILSTTAE